MGWQMMTLRWQDIFAHDDYTDADASGACSTMVFRARR